MSSRSKRRKSRRDMHKAEHNASIGTGWKNEQLYVVGVQNIEVNPVGRLKSGHFVVSENISSELYVVNPCDGKNALLLKLPENTLDFFVSDNIFILAAQEYKNPGKSMKVSEWYGSKTRLKSVRLAQPFVHIYDCLTGKSSTSIFSSADKNSIDDRVSSVNLVDENKDLVVEPISFSFLISDKSLCYMIDGENGVLRSKIKGKIHEPKYGLDLNGNILSTYKFRNLAEFPGTLVKGYAVNVGKFMRAIQKFDSDCYVRLRNGVFERKSNEYK